MSNWNSLKRNRWDRWHLVTLAGLVAAGIAGTWEAWTDIAQIAVRDEEASHIFLVPIVFGWLIWVRRPRLRRCRPVGNWAGPLLAGIGWVLSSIGYNHAIQAFWHGGSLLLVLGCVVTAVGLEVVWQFLPAFAVLVFLVPVPGMLRQRIAIPLQTATAEVTHQVFEVLGLNVPRSGNVLSINGTEVGIAEACNGLRMVFALVLVSYAFAFGSPLRWYVRGLILAACPLSAIACNVIRLVPTVWLYGYGSTAMAETFHNVSGWGMLVVAFLLLFAILRALRWALVPVTQYTLAYD
ncbi:MAG: exosortase/archaeosortase family protein [Planctomycetota bacterium]